MTTNTTDMRKYRMYGLVPYNISAIQQAIQYGHAVVEYANDYFNDEDYTSWSMNDKTFIILNGGTTNLGKPVTHKFLIAEKTYTQVIQEGTGTLNQHLETLRTNEIKVATFHEPDLGDQLTAVVFLVDDRVWDKENWHDFVPLQIDGYTIEFQRWKDNFGEDADKIVFLREFLSQFRLA